MEQDNDRKATEALARAVGALPATGLGGPSVNVLGFLYEGTPVVARMDASETGVVLAETLTAVLRDITGTTTPVSLDPPDPEEVRRIQVRTLREAIYRVGHPDSQGTPLQVLKDLLTDVSSGEVVIEP